MEIEKANDKTPRKYHQAYIFTKRTNLLSYAEGKCDHAISTMAYQAYSAEREVRLILLVRYEENRPVCRIKCPINPLPIKGEFTAVSTGTMMSLLNTLGWSFKEKHNLYMFE